MDSNEEYFNTTYYTFSVYEEVNVTWSIDEDAVAAGVTIDEETGVLDAQSINDDVIVSVTATPEEGRGYVVTTVTFPIKEKASGMN